MGKSIHRRKHYRHVAPENALILFNSRVGQIIDLSESGMAINLSSSRKPLPVRSDGTSSCRSTMKEIDKLPLRIVRSGEIKPNTFGNYASQTIGVAFDYQDDNQHKLIREHLIKMS